MRIYADWSCRVSRAVLFYSATAGAGVLFAAGESGEKAAGKKREGDGEMMVLIVPDAA